MSEFSRKIKELNTPTIQNRREYSVVAKVTAINEKNNVCSIEFIDKEGYRSNKDNVPVKIILPGFVAWFPKVNEKVIVEIKENYLTITGKVEDGYGSVIRPKFTTKQDIYSTSFGGTMAGSIF